MTEQNLDEIKTEEQLKEQVDIIFNDLIKKPEVSEALDLLDKLPESLKYHNKNHTLDVIKETILFAAAEDASQDTIEQQVIAAAWHDVGHIKGSENHESASVELFKQSEAYKKLLDINKADIINSILSTKIYIESGSPRFDYNTKGFGYVLDADVSNFGREDFWENRKKVVEELGLDWENIEIRKKFLKFTIYLLKNHEWKTASAKKLREETKKKNLALMIEEYNQLGE